MPFMQKIFCWKKNSETVHITPRIFYKKCQLLETFSIKKYKIFGRFLQNKRTFHSKTLRYFLKQLN